MPFSSQVTDRVGVVASVDPTSKNESVSVGEPRARDPVYPQPVVRRRGRPKRTSMRTVHADQMVTEVPVDKSPDTETVTEEASVHEANVCMTSCHIVQEFTELSDTLEELWKVLVTAEKKQHTYDVVETGELLTVSENECILKGLLKSPK